MVSQEKQQDFTNKLGEMFESDDNVKGKFKESFEKSIEDFFDQNQVSCSCVIIKKTKIASQNPFLSEFFQRLEKNSQKAKKPGNGKNKKK